uniref:Cytochrome P450 n=1 Tax=Balaenoptera musculus TaxID=9771 RepID=A0A8C0DU65_BALMU
MLASGLLPVALPACLTILVLMSVWRQRKLEGKLPPGPTPLPFVGNYLQLNTKQMYNSFMKISERYGPVFTVRLGPWRVVVLCGYDTVTEALVDQAEEVSGRGKQANFNWLFKAYGLAFGNWERAEQPRRFSITTLRDFGVGKRGIEERIQGEADFLIEVCRGTRGAFLDPTFFLSRTVSNVISSIVFGGRFDYEDKEFLSLLCPSLPFFSPHPQHCEMFYSVTKHLPGPQQQAFKELQGLEDFIAEKVEQSQCALDPNSPWNLIDSFFIRMQEEKKNPNTEFYLKNLVLTTLNLFFAGTETVSTTLLLIKHPDMEGKEIDHVIGKSHQPKFKDGAKMPYTEDPNSHASHFPSPRSHKFPLHPQVLSAHPSPTLPYQSPLPPPNQGTEVFPMLEQASLPCLPPVPSGKRYCFGEGLARMELFLFLTTIMQNFRFKSPQSPQDIDVSPKHVGFVTIP